MCVFLGIERYFAESEFWKNLVLECLAFGHFNLHTTCLTNDSKDKFNLHGDESQLNDSFPSIALF